MTLLARLTLEGVYNGDYPNLYPQVNGRGDTGRITDLHVFPEPGVLGSGFPLISTSLTNMATPALRQTTFLGNPSSFGLSMESSRSTYSASWCMAAEQEPGFQQDDRFFWAMDGATRRWGIKWWGGVALDFSGTLIRRLNICNASGNDLGSTPSYKWPINTSSRFEISVSGGTVTLRVYIGTSTTPALNITRTPTSVTADRLSWGTLPAFASGHLAALKVYDNFHVWDTADGDGAMPAFRYVRPDWTATEWNGATEDPLTIDGYIATTGALSTTSLAAALAAHTTQPMAFLSSREVAPPASSSTAHTYGARTGQTYRLHRPTATAPAGGWPVVAVVNLNFFVTGDSTSINTEWRDRLLAAGFAVASIGINPSQLTTGAYDTANYGVFPSHLKDVKTALRHLQANAAGHPIDVTKVILFGHSSGGYCALGAMVTRDLDATGLIAGGVDFRIGSGADPDVLGCMVTSAPIDLAATRTADPTHPNYGTPANLYGVGAIHSVASALMGGQANSSSTSLAGTHLGDLLQLNTARFRPTRYHWSASDWTVPASLNHVAWTSAITTAGLGAQAVSFEEDQPNHDQIAREISSSAIAWMLDLL